MNRCTRFLKNNTRITQIAFAIATSAFMAGCGMGPYSNSNGWGSSNTDYDSWNAVGGQGSGSGSNGYATVNASNGGSIAPMTIESDNTSRTSQRNPRTVSVTTSTKLRVRYVPGLNTKNIFGTGWFYQYSRFKVTFVVGNQSFTTNFASNGYSSAAEPQIIDLSAGLPACTGTVSQCRKTVTVTVQEPIYDFCQGWGVPGCGERAVDDGKPWNIKVQFETNDTPALVQ